MLAWAGLLCLGGVVLAWTVISTAFPTVNRHMDSGQFRRDFQTLTARERAHLTLWTLTLVLGLIVAALALAFVYGLLAKVAVEPSQEDVK